MTPVRKSGWRRSSVEVDDDDDDGGVGVSPAAAKEETR